MYDCLVPAGTGALESVKVIRDKATRRVLQLDLSRSGPLYSGCVVLLLTF